MSISRRVHRAWHSIFERHATARASLGLGLLGALGGTAAAPSLAHAQRAAATVQQFQEAAPITPSDRDLRLQLTAGGTGALGNTQSVGFNVGASIEYRDGADQIGAELTYLYGYAQQPLSCAADPLGIGCAALDPTMMTPSSVRAGGFQDWAESANNLNWRLRYDHFFDEDNSVFAAHRGRRDPFAGLDVRLTIQAGYSRNLFREENHRLWADLGIDATYDDYSATVQRQLETTRPSLPPLQSYDSRFVPSVRVFLGYDNHTNESLTFKTGLEVLWNVVNPSHFRFDWQNQIRSRINGFLELGIDVTLRLDAQPPGQGATWRENVAYVNPMDPTMTPRAGQVTRMFDMITTLNLVGTFDLDGERQAAAEEAAAVEAAVEAATDSRDASDTAAPATAPTHDETQREGASDDAGSAPTDGTDDAAPSTAGTGTTTAPAATTPAATP